MERDEIKKKQFKTKKNQQKERGRQLKK